MLYLVSTFKELDWQKNESDYLLKCDWEVTYLWKESARFNDIEIKCDKYDEKFIFSWQLKKKSSRMSWAKWKNRAKTKKENEVW